MNSLKQPMKKTLTTIHPDTITSVEILNDTCIYTCDDDTILAHNLATDTHQTVYSGRKSKTPDEISCLKKCMLNGTECLLAANNEFLQLFDCAAAKQMNKYKFFKDTINAIELNEAQTSVVCCDDSGDIKALDIRIKPTKDKSVITLPTVTLKKSLRAHTNICSGLKLNPLNEHELFSGSFDCTVLKWDLRYVKKPAGDTISPFVSKICVDETIKMINEKMHSEELFISTMTPCFVHSIHLANIDNKSLLLCGIENGLCILYDAATCNYLHHDQLQKFNCALTQISPFYTDQDSPNPSLACSGNGKTIEFFKINSTKYSGYSIEAFEELKINQERKVNCLRYMNRKLVVADVSADLTIYDFTRI